MGDKEARFLPEKYHSHEQSEIVHKISEHIKLLELKAMEKSNA